MALNFTVSYAFSPNTTISSSQVNTNTNDVANVFTGIEALTKTLAKLKIDSDPATALEVATKQYVDHYATLRRPTLQWGSVTTVAVESGLDGTSGDIPIQFPDGSVRTETSTTRTTFDITRNAVLTTSGAQSGLTGATSEATNTWYALYACKVTDLSTQWCTVGSTVFPSQANYSTLNTAYGASGWVYLGCIRNGDNSGATGDILFFKQSGNHFAFVNECTSGASLNQAGLRLATGTGTSLTYTYAGGTGTTQIPGNIVLGEYAASIAGGVNSTVASLTQQVSTTVYYARVSQSGSAIQAVLSSGMVGLSFGAVSSANQSSPMDIFLRGYIDNVLGVGANPLL